MFSIMNKREGLCSIDWGIWRCLVAIMKLIGAFISAFHGWTIAIIEYSCVFKLSSDTTIRAIMHGVLLDNNSVFCIYVWSDPRIPCGSSITVPKVGTIFNQQL